MTSRHALAVVSALVFAALAGAPAHADTAPSPFPVNIEASAGGGTVNYFINVRNTVDAPATLLVVQRFTGNPSAVKASGEGKVQAGAVAWNLVVPPNDINRVSSEAAFHAGTATLSTVCLADPATQQVLDCASGDLPASAQAARKQRPGWTVVIGLVAAGAALALLGYLAWRFRHRWASRWWPKTRRWVADRRNTLAVVGAGFAVLVVAAGAVALVVSRAEPFLAEQAGTNKESIGWSGQVQALQVGRPASSRQVEFTLYQWSCAEAKCVAVVAVRNVTKAAVPWLARMQRLKDTKGNWLQPDSEMTVAANAGTDPFATPLAAHERRLTSLVFKVPAPATLTRLELREGAFAAGVSLQLK